MRTTQPLHHELVHTDHEVYLDFGVGCVEEDCIKDLKFKISASELSEFVDSSPCEEMGFGKGNQCLVSLLKSMVNGSSDIGLDCFDVSTYNDELGAHSWSSCNSEKLVTVREIVCAHECKVCNDAEVGKNRLASIELRLAEDCPRIKMEFKILNHFVDRSITIVKGGNLI